MSNLIQLEGFKKRKNVSLIYILVIFTIGVFFYTPSYSYELPIKTKITNLSERNISKHELIKILEFDNFNFSMFVSPKKLMSNVVSFKSELNIKKIKSEFKLPIVQIDLMQPQKMKHLTSSSSIYTPFLYLNFKETNFDECFFSNSNLSELSKEIKFMAIADNPKIRKLKFNKLISSESKSRDFNYLVRRYFNTYRGSEWVYAHQDKTTAYMKLLNENIYSNEILSFNSNSKISHVNFRVWENGNRLKEVIIPSTILELPLIYDGEIYSYKFDFSRYKKNSRIEDNLKNKYHYLVKEIYIHLNKDDQTLIVNNFQIIEENIKNVNLLPLKNQVLHTNNEFSYVFDFKFLLSNEINYAKLNSEKKFFIIGDCAQKIKSAKLLTTNKQEVDWWLEENNRFGRAIFGDYSLFGILDTSNFTSLSLLFALDIKSSPNKDYIPGVKYKKKLSLLEFTNKGMYFGSIELPKNSYLIISSIDHDGIKKANLKLNFKDETIKTLEVEINKPVPLSNIKGKTIKSISWDFSNINDETSKRYQIKILSIESGDANIFTNQAIGRLQWEEYIKLSLSNNTSKKINLGSLTDFFVDHNSIKIEIDSKNMDGLPQDKMNCLFSLVFESKLNLLNEYQCLKIDGTKNIITINPETLQYLKTKEIESTVFLVINEAKTLQKKLNKVIIEKAAVTTETDVIFPFVGQKFYFDNLILTSKNKYEGTQYSNFISSFSVDVEINSKKYENSDNINNDYFNYEYLELGINDEEHSERIIKFLENEGVEQEIKTQDVWSTFNIKRFVYETIIFIIAILLMFGIKSSVKYILAILSKKYKRIFKPKSHFFYVYIIHLVLFSICMVFGIDDVSIIIFLSLVYNISFNMFKIILEKKLI